MQRGQDMNLFIGCCVFYGLDSNAFETVLHPLGLPGSSLALQPDSKILPDDPMLYQMLIFFGVFRCVCISIRGLAGRVVGRLVRR